MATTTSTTSIGGGGADDRVMATAQQIVKSLNTSKNVREDMLLILSSFDNRLSNITNLIDAERAAVSKLDAAEKVIFRQEPPSTAVRGIHSMPSWEESPEEAGEYLAAVDEVLELLEELSLREEAEADTVDRAEIAVQVAMSRLEDEFRQVLVRNTVPLDADKIYGSIRRNSIVFMGNEEIIDGEFESFDSDKFHERGGSLSDDLCVDLISPDAIADLKEIADRMIRSKYEIECVQVYSNVRRDALSECLLILGVEKLSIEEVQRIEWKNLDDKMKKWVRAIKIGVRVLLSGEKRLCDQIFSGSESAKEVCFNEIAKGCVMQLLNFSEAVAIGKRSPEKLFRILDMYDALRGVLVDLQMMVTDEFVYSDAEGVLALLGESVKGTFVEFENAVQNETSRKPMLGGEIHPLTRYVMNYVKLVADYSGTLNSLLASDNDEPESPKNDNDERIGDCTPLGRRLLALLSNLELNLEEKSRLYDDGAVQYIFLMNNILYLVQKVKDSDLIKLLGDQWVRKRRGQVRQCATSYLRAAWSKALLCLKDEGFSGSSGSYSHSYKMNLKERFKNFNACFEEIYRVQTGWKVPDPQLREELRISISEKVIPAYRAFWGRFAGHLESARNSGKYIKYTADDLENYLLDLFEGTPLVLHHLRRKNS